MSLRITTIFLQYWVILQIIDDVNSFIATIKLVALRIRIKLGLWTMVLAQIKLLKLKGLSTPLAIQSVSESPNFPEKFFPWDSIKLPYEGYKFSAIKVRFWLVGKRNLALSINGGDLVCFIFSPLTVKLLHLAKSVKFIAELTGKKLVLWFVK